MIKRANKIFLVSWVADGYASLVHDLNDSIRTVQRQATLRHSPQLPVPTCSPNVNIYIFPLTPTHKEPRWNALQSILTKS